MGNNRNKRVENGQDIKNYLEEMIKNAEKHGITIQTVTFKAYRIGHGGILNPELKEDDIEEIVEDSKAILEKMAINLIMGGSYGKD